MDALYNGLTPDRVRLGMSGNQAFTMDMWRKLAREVLDDESYLERNGSFQFAGYVVHARSDIGLWEFRFPTIAAAKDAKSRMASRTRLQWHIDEAFLFTPALAL